MNKNVEYYILDNIAIINQIFNFFLNRYSSICLFLIEKSRLTKNRKNLNEILKKFCILDTIINKILILKKARSKIVLNERQMIEFHNALRTAQPELKLKQYYG